MSGRAAASVEGQLSLRERSFSQSEGASEEYDVRMKVSGGGTRLERAPLARDSQRT